MVSRKSFAILGLVFISAASSPAIFQLIGQQLNAPKYRFEDYETYMGYGAVDVERAENDFLRLVQIGASLSEIDVFFERIGGRCFEIVESKGKYYCSYSHAIPLGLVVSRNWSAIVDFNEHTRTISSIKLSSTLEGP